MNTERKPCISALGVIVALSSAAIVTFSSAAMASRNGGFSREFQEGYRGVVRAGKGNSQLGSAMLGMVAVGFVGLMSLTLLLVTLFPFLDSDLYWVIGNLVARVTLFFAAGAAICWLKNILLAQPKGRRVANWLVDRVTWREDLLSLVLSLVAHFLITWF